MSNEPTPPRWFSGWRTRQAPDYDDPADMGTAFGLDLSLSEIPHEPVAATAAPGLEPGWVRRLTGRSKPAA